LFFKFLKLFHNIILRDDTILESKKYLIDTTAVECSVKFVERERNNFQRITQVLSRRNCEHMIRTRNCGNFNMDFKSINNLLYFERKNAHE
jgi:hypothetical protein